jgi:hypothetical protein
MSLKLAKIKVLIKDFFKSKGLVNLIGIYEIHCKNKVTKINEAFFFSLIYFSNMKYTAILSF